MWHGSVYAHCFLAPDNHGAYLRARDFATHKERKESHRWRRVQDRRASRSDWIIHVTKQAYPVRASSTGPSVVVVPPLSWSRKWRQPAPHVLLLHLETIHQTRPSMSFSASHWIQQSHKTPHGLNASVLQLVAQWAAPHLRHHVVHDLSKQNRSLASSAAPSVKGRIILTGIKERSVSPCLRCRRHGHKDHFAHRRACRCPAPAKVTCHLGGPTPHNLDNSTLAASSARVLNARIDTSVNGNFASGHHQVDPHACVMMQWGCFSTLKDRVSWDKVSRKQLQT